MEAYLRKLANHANLVAFDEPEDNAPEKSLLYCLWQAERTGEFPDIISLRDDILQCLAEANIVVNGPVPSKKQDGHLKSISAPLALYVCQIVHECYEYAIVWEQRSLFTVNNRAVLKQSAWMIMDAWCYILHGDFDDIVAEAQLVGEIKEIL